MERARSYQATLEVMYVQDHQHAGRLIHFDHRCDLKILVSQYYEEILDMKEASGAVKIRELNFHKSLRHRCFRHCLRPTTVTMLTPTADGRTPPPSIRRRSAGAAGPRTRPLPLPLRLNRRRMGKARERTSNHACARRTACAVGSGM
jgi:hypothetical protein